jgi:triosephosphate isomerase
LVVVGLKMYFDVPQTVRWCTDVAELARNHDAVRSGAVELAVVPSLPAIPAAAMTLHGSGVVLGAQDLYHEDRGAYTGAVSGVDLHQIGCRYVEIGHAERRRYFGDDDQEIALKVAAAWRNSLVPLLCVGEPEGTRPSEAAQVCRAQLDAALASVHSGPPQPIALAYEPIWAIGETTPASTTHIATVVTALRDEMASDDRIGDFRVVYGGSAGVGLLTELADTTDGLFLGRFAHEIGSLRKILDEAVELR